MVPGATDCHLHRIERDLFPYDTRAGGYLPGDHEQGRLGDLLDLLAAHDIARGVIVQPSCYGEDFSAAKDACNLHPGRFAAIAPMTAKATVAGYRLNLVNHPGYLDRPEVRQRLTHAARADRVIEVQCPAALLPDVLPSLRDSGARLVFDHLGYPDPGDGVASPGFRALLELAGEKRHFVKLSGAFRLSNRPFPHTDLDPFADAILSRFGAEGCVWGSDWPFVNCPRRPTYAETLGQLDHWVPSAADRAVILAATPAAAFGWPAP